MIMWLGRTGVLAATLAGAAIPSAALACDMHGFGGFHRFSAFSAMMGSAHSSDVGQQSADRVDASGDSRTRSSSPDDGLEERRGTAARDEGAQPDPVPGARLEGRAGL